MENNNSPLYSALKEALSLSRPEVFSRLSEELSLLDKNFSRQQFNYLFSIAPSPRWFGTESMIPQSIDILEPFNAGGRLSEFSCSQAARLYIVFTLNELVEVDTYTECINDLFKTADNNEHTMLVQSLPYLPSNELFIDRAREAARSNIGQIFCAIAYDNTYAQNQFDDDGWNQLVLKAAFLEVPIWSISGLRQRSNPKLADMLKDYADERQSAGRHVPWDIYCVIGWEAKSDEELEFLTQEYERGNDETRHAILCALAENGSAKALATSKTLGAVGEHKNWHEIAFLQH